MARFIEVTPKFGLETEENGTFKVDANTTIRVTTILGEADAEQGFQMIEITEGPDGKPLQAALTPVVMGDARFEISAKQKAQYLIQGFARKGNSGFRTSKVKTDNVEDKRFTYFFDDSFGQDRDFSDHAVRLEII